MADRAEVEARDAKMMFNGKPFPWEPSIENQKPIDVFSKTVGDFLFFNVLTNGHMEEIRSRGVQLEIEAKLGTIIDKATNDRIFLPVKAGECVMGEEARIAFRSSMTEVSTLFHSTVFRVLLLPLPLTLPLLLPAYANHL